MGSTTLPSTMKAWVLEEFNTPYRLRDVPVPRINDPSDVLIRVDACSYCHTDAVVAAGTVTRPELPHIGCHEYTGTIVALPPEKTECHGLVIGDRIAVRGCGYHACANCRECQNPSGPLPDSPGYSVYCPLAGAGLGIDRPGGFGEFAIVEAKQTALIPDGLSSTEVAPLMCAGLTIYTALIKCNLEAGMRVGIIGCGGGLGHLGLQFATRMGLKTVGIDTSARALDLARQLSTGATIIDGTKETAKSLRQKIGEEDGCELFQQMGLDAAIILPESQIAFDYGMDLVRDGGLAMLLSFPPDGFRISAIDIVLRRIRLEGSLIGSNRAIKDMFEFCVKHGVRAQTTTYKFSELNELVEDYHKGVPGKLVLDMEVLE